MVTKDSHDGLLLTCPWSLLVGLFAAVVVAIKLDRKISAMGLSLGTRDVSKLKHVVFPLS